MSNQEFENYIALMGKLLQLSKEQREQISGELQDHLQMRVADLISDGVAKPDAISQAIDEFGDAAVMAKNFQSVLNLKRRRWMMRFATFSIAGTFLVAVLTMALWPDNSRFGAPDFSSAITQEGGASIKAQEKLGPQLSVGTQQTLIAEEALRQVVSLNYDETPYSEVERLLEEKTGLNFLLTSSAMDDVLTEDEPITFQLNNMPLKKALKLMLETKNATYVIDEGIVVIISLDDAEDFKWFRLKMFDCRELVKALPETSPPVINRGGGFGGGGQGGGGGMFAIQAMPIQNSGQPQTQPVQATQNTNESQLLDQKLDKILSIMKAEAARNRPKPSSEYTLLNLVQSMIQPDSWEDTGQGLGGIEVVNGILVVSQTEEILSEIESFLADLEGNILKNGNRGVSLKALKRPRKVATTSDLRSKDSNSAEDPFGGNPKKSDDPFGK